MLLSEKLQLFMTGRMLEDVQAITSSEKPSLLLREEEVKIHSAAPIYSGCSFVGAHSYMGEFGAIRGDVFIGRYCSIGRRVSMSAGYHPMHGLSTSPALFTLNKHAPPYSASEALSVRDNSVRVHTVIIGSDVWIGDGAIIMSGLKIGTGAVIAANAVVTKDVPPYSIVAGTPARQLEQGRFETEISQRLADSEWWEYPHKLIQSLPVGNIFRFLDALETSCAEKAHYATYR